MNIKIMLERKEKARNMKENDPICDVLDGSQYQRLLKAGNCLSDEFAFS